MNDHLSDPSRVEAWGDVAMPAEAQQRQDQLDDITAAAVDGGQPLPPASALAGDPPRGAASRSQAERGRKQTDDPTPAHLDYSQPAPGPGGEAMLDGTSPAPRGYSGGAMGKFVAGLSPTFAEAARGNPPPGGPWLYTKAELLATFGPTGEVENTSSTKPA